jgi:hypothetical protein
MQTFQVRWEGKAPLMMHNRQLANPLNHFAKEIKKITGKRKKTDDDYEGIAWLEFQGGLYWDEKLGVFIPAENVHACIRDAAKIMRQGENVKRGLTVIEPEHGDKIPLEAEYPKNLRKMFEGGWADVRPVVVTGTCLRCRPIFRPPWAIQFTIGFNERIFDGPQQIMDIIEIAGTMTGFSEGRPTNGRFTATIISGDANGRGSRTRSVEERGVPAVASSA